MKKKEIIKSKFEYTEIINNARYKKNDYFVIYYRKNDTDNRYGISVPKKTGKAHIRNKIKRRLKNILDNNKIDIQKTYDYVIIIRKRVLELSYHQMEESFISLIKRIGVNQWKKTKTKFWK